jgi:hypothetical protein
MRLTSRYARLSCLACLLLSLYTGHDADRVIVMADGQIREMGSHRELVAAGGPYAALWRPGTAIRSPRPAAHPQSLWMKLCTARWKEAMHRG